LPQAFATITIASPVSSAKRRCSRRSTIQTSLTFTASRNRAVVPH
jgi:hypothetical protein